MGRPPWVPARDSRHRLAVLALYRALIRSASHVSLPPDLSAAVAPASPARYIAKTVRQRFDKNRSYSSPRLIYASMTAGYRILTMLTKARDPESAEHAELVGHVRDRVDAAGAARELSASLPQPPRPPPAADKPPLLVNTAEPGEPPRYAMTLVPRISPALGAMKNPHRRATLGMTSHGQPFLRMAKPQPPEMSRMIGLKDRTYRERVERVIWCNEDHAPQAALEDQWDELVTQQISREVGYREAVRQDDSQQVGEHATYTWHALLSRLWYEFKIEQTWQDWRARGHAFNQFLDEERRLSEAESKSRNDALALARESAQNRALKVPLPTVRPNVAEWPASKLPFFDFLKNPPVRSPEEAQAKAEAEARDDPFLSYLWRRLVRGQSPRIKAWRAAVVAQLNDHTPRPTHPDTISYKARRVNMRKRREWPKLPEWASDTERKPTQQHSWSESDLDDPDPKYDPKYDYNM